MFSAVLAGPERSDEFFKKWVETVKASVPPERLLIFEVKQGECRYIKNNVDSILSCRQKKYSACNKDGNKAQMTCHGKGRLNIIFLFRLGTFVQISRTSSSRNSLSSCQWQRLHEVRGGQCGEGRVGLDLCHTDFDRWTHLLLQRINHKLPWFLTKVWQ